LELKGIKSNCISLGLSLMGLIHSSRSSNCFGKKLKL
jgi:hypothetical protein